MTAKAVPQSSGTVFSSVIPATLRRSTAKRRVLRIRPRHDPVRGVERGQQRESIVDPFGGVSDNKLASIGHDRADSHQTLIVPVADFEAPRTPRSPTGRGTRRPSDGSGRRALFERPTAPRPTVRLSLGLRPLRGRYEDASSETLETSPKTHQARTLRTGPSALPEWRGWDLNPRPSGYEAHQQPPLRCAPAVSSTDDQQQHAYLMMASVLL